MSYSEAIISKAVVITLWHIEERLHDTGGIAILICGDDRVLAAELERHQAEHGRYPLVIALLGATYHLLTPEGWVCLISQFRFAVSHGLVTRIRLFEHEGCGFARHIYQATPPGELRKIQLGNAQEARLRLLQELSPFGLEEVEIYFHEWKPAE